MDLKQRLFELKDEKYRAFSESLLPKEHRNRVLGVSMPKLRKLLPQIPREEFMARLPHEFHEEDMLHVLLIGQLGDYTQCIRETERFLPYVDNWAVCDSLRPKIFKSHKAELVEDIRRWLGFEHCYTRRFALEMLMLHFLGEDFREEYLSWAVFPTEEYYLKMMQAWFFATALTEQYEAALPFIEKGLCDTWTHNKAIQKAVESLKISKDRKEHLRTLKK